MHRRTFLKAAAWPSASLVLGYCTSTQQVMAADSDSGFANPWLRIAPDNSVTMVTPRAEMGQDVYTSLPLLIAEELDYPIAHVRVELAPMNAQHYGNPSAVFMGRQATGGSLSVRSHWLPLRKIGATARALLVQAAAQRWGVSPADCRTESGHVRCAHRQASYGELASAAAALPLPADVPLKTTQAFRQIGRPARRLDTPGKVSGSAVFGVDVRYPGMLCAAMLHCPVIGGKPLEVDARQALQTPGVQGVYTLPMGVAVVAQDFHQAQQAKALLKVRWDTGDTHTRRSTAAMMERLHQAAQQPGPTVLERGDAAGAIAQAPVQIQAQYEQPFLAHATLEPMNCSVAIEGDRCQIWGPFQIPDSVHRLGQSLLNMPADKVQVHTTFIGGGYGRKAVNDVAREAILVAQACGRPVRLIWSREDDMQHDFYRPASLHHMRAGLDGKGQVVGITVQLTSPSPSVKAVPAWVRNGVDMFMAEGLDNFLYSVPHLKISATMQDLDLRVGFWRGVSNNLNAFASESFLDELALASRRDALDFRLALLEQQPRAREVLQRAAQMAGWGQPLAPGHALGVAQTECYDTYVALVAEVSEHDGQPRVHRLVCVVDPGIAVRPEQIEAQIEGGILLGYSSAMFNEITLKDGVVEQDNFDTYRLLRIGDAPRVQVQVLSTNHPPGGVGEAGVPLVAPAIANAFARASGRRLRKLPLAAT